MGALLTVLKSKLHRCRVTSSNLHYEGSIAIARELMRAAGICEFEKVAVFDVNNGNRFETYAVRAGRGEVIVNGAAARLAKKGDVVIIVSYAIVGENEARKAKPKIVYVDSENRLKKG